VEPAGRTLRLLGLLQSRPTWPAAELAERLGTTGRTLRRDLARLKELGYAVESRPGPGGHYALRAGARVPPLLFEPDEAVALVAALRMAEDRLAGDAATRALAELDRLLPTGAVTGAARTTARGTEVAHWSEPAIDPEIDPAVLASLTRAGAEDRAAAYDYEDRDGHETRRRVDTVRCVWSRGQWYVVAWDLDRDDWRLFRLDRVRAVSAGERRAHPREGLPEDLVSWFESDLGRARRPGPAG
jgi:predicted DNA-binding transcriptional regulator YafY